MFSRKFWSLGPIADAHVCSCVIMLLAGDIIRYDTIADVKQEFLLETIKFTSKAYKVCSEIH